jgi:dTDP-4-amino-4,6-dideoxygalactose transaminase
VKLSLCRVGRAVPSWNGYTYLQILRCLLSGHVVSGPDLDYFRLLIRHIFPDRRVVLCGSGTFALEVALREVDVNPGDEVIVPTFCCSSIVPPILACGAVPVFADCGEDLNLAPDSVEAMLTNKTKAIVVAHLYGNPAGIQQIADLADATGIRVIDDAAQALGARVDLQLVGSFGHAGILSFGSEKVVAGMGGGALLLPQNTNDSIEMELPVPSSARAVQKFLSTLLKWRWRRFRLGELLFSPTLPDPEALPQYRKEALANLDAAIAATVLKGLDDIVTARRARVRAYQELLGSDERLELITHQPGSACLSQVVRIFPRNRQDLAARVVDTLGNAGYEIQGSYIPIHLLAPFRQFTRRRLNYAENVWPDLVELPCEPHVSLDHVERIAAILKSNISGDAGCARGLPSPEPQ